MGLFRKTVLENLLFYLAITLSILVVSNTKAEIPKPEDVLQKILQSYQTVNFKGNLMFVSRGPEEGPVREALIIRKAPDKQRIEFLMPEEAKGTGMIINGRDRWPIQRNRDREKGTGPDRRFPPRPPLPPPDSMMEKFSTQNIKFLLKNYDIRILNGGSVAGRDTYLLELESKISPRPSRKIWMDKENGVILKMERYDTEKKLRGFFVFSEIDFKPKIDDSELQGRPGVFDRFRPRPEGEREDLWNYEQGKLDHEKIIKEVKMNIVFPEKLPAGFILQSIREMKFRDQKTVHLSYTDGLAMLSVFQSQIGEKKPFEKPPDDRRPDDRKPERGPRPEPKTEQIKIGNVNSQLITAGPMLIFKWNLNNIDFTLMGEMERREIIKIVKVFMGN